MTTRVNSTGILNLLTTVIFAIPQTVVPTTAQTIGMVVDNLTNKMIVFNADSDTILDSVPIRTGVSGDCSITADRTLGFATDFNSRVWVINLTASPPSLALGTNPIVISNLGEDTAITPDQKFLVACDGSISQPVSVVDIATRHEVSTFSLGSDCNSVDVCRDGSVLVTSNRTGNVHRLKISVTGILTDAGEVLFSGGTGDSGPNSVFCAPGGRAGLVVRRRRSQLLELHPGEIRSFTIPGLALVDVRTLSGTGLGISGLVNSPGDRVFARSAASLTQSGEGGAVDVFGFNSSTGALSPAPLLSIPILSTIGFFGMDQMALHPNGDKLYVPQPNGLKVFDARSGTLLKTMTSPDIIQPTGVCLSAAPAHRLRSALAGSAIGGLKPSGRAEFREEPATGERRFRVELEDVNLARGTVLVVLVGDVVVGQITLDSDQEGELELNTREGDTVPPMAPGQMIVIRGPGGPILTGVLSSE